MRGGEPEPPRRERGARGGRAGVEATPVAGQSPGSPFLLRAPSVSGAAARGPGRREGPGLAEARPPPPEPTTPADGAGRLWLGLRETDGRGRAGCGRERGHCVPHPATPGGVMALARFPRHLPGRCPRPAPPGRCRRWDVASLFRLPVPRLGSALPLGGTRRGVAGGGDSLSPPPALGGAGRRQRGPGSRVPAPFIPPVRRADISPSLSASRPLSRPPSPVSSAARRVSALSALLSGGLSRLPWMLLGTRSA